MLRDPQPVLAATVLDHQLARTTQQFVAGDAAHRGALLAVD